LDRLVRLGRQQRPSLIVAGSTINGWLNGRAVPGPAHDRYFWVLAAFFQSEAARLESGYTARTQAWWQELLSRARQERSARRGGRPPVHAPAGLPPGPVTLPPDPVGFAGRTAQLDMAMDWLDPGSGQTEGQGAAAVVAVAGMGGIGKTALAVHAAHRARARGWFPGGILFADLRGYSNDAETEIAAVTDRFLRALGLRAKDLPATAEEKLDAWRLHLDQLAVAGRPLLVLLDNVRIPGQITALLPAAPHRALVTSRHVLSSLPARRIGLGPLSPPESLDLVQQALRAGGTADERVATQNADALRMARLCGHLPLALRIISALLRDEPDRRLASQADELEDARARLDAIVYDGDDGEGRPLAVRASFELSYQHLSQRNARAFRLLASAPGPDISTGAAAVLLQEKPVAARRLLANLARAHLLQPGTDSYRWSMHNLIRLFADGKGRARAEDDCRNAALTRLLDFYLAAAGAADSHLRPLPGRDTSSLFDHRDQAVNWLDTERSNLIAAALVAPEHDHRAATELPWALAQFLSWRRYHDDWLRLANAAGAIAREAGDLPGEARALSFVGIALTDLDKFDEAIVALTTAVDIFHGLGDLASEGHCWGNLGLALRHAGRLEEAIAAHHCDLATCLAVDDWNGASQAVTNAGVALHHAGRLAEALSAHEAAVLWCREDGNPHGEATARNNYGKVLSDLGRGEESLAFLSQSLELFQEVGDRDGEAMALNSYGLSLIRLGSFDEATEAFTASAALYRESGDVRGERIALDNARESMSEKPEAG
jgi:tetratricopeptide (TPR) repeat protein